MKKNVSKWAVIISVCMMFTVLLAMPVQAKTSKLEQKAASIVTSQINTEMDNTAKLQKLFTYAEKTFRYQRTMGFKATKGWQESYALQMLTKKKGSCYHDAAAFAYLAKEATGYTVRVCIGKTNGFSGRWQPHAWCEVKINGKWYVFDTNMDRYAEKSSGKYYMKLCTSKAMKKTYKTSKTVKIAF